MPNPAPMAVEAATRTPMAFGLFSVVQFRPETLPHWQVSGVEWEEKFCGLGVNSIGTYQCDTATSGLPKTLDSGGTEIGNATPFTVYAPYQCSPIGGSDGQEEANQRLLTGEQSAVERELWMGSRGTQPAFHNTETVDYGKVEAKKAIAALEQYAAENYLGQGVIHVRPYEASFLASDGLIESSGGIMRTKLGTSVVIGAGYSNAWATITPPLFGYRSEVFSSSNRRGDLANLSRNDWTFIAERTYLIGFDQSCGTASVEFSDIVPSDGVNPGTAPIDLTEALAAL